MKILLIHPQNSLQRYSNGLYGKPLRYAAITMPTLAALVPPELAAEVRVVDEMVADIPLDAEADLVALTAITSAAPRAYELARHFRSRGVKVVMGGVHATLNPDEVQPHVDSLVLGYAEESWPRMLRDFAAGELKPRYEMPVPFMPASIVEPHRCHIRRRDYIAPHCVEMSRGCNQRCEYCVSHQFHEQYIMKDVAKTIDEIRSMNGKLVSFIDPNVIGNIAHARAFFTEFAKLNRYWVGCASINLMDNPELLDLFVRSGCKGLLVGFESVNQASLNAANKGFSQVADYKRIIAKLHRHGIMVQGTFVLGFDTDDTSTFENTAQFIIDAKIDLAQMTIYTPFPGTAAFRRLEQEGRILTRDWNLYNGQNVVFKPAQMTPEELHAGLELVWRRVYRYRAIAKRLWGPPYLLKAPIAFSNLYLRHYQYALLRSGRRV
jgi:radical SAM superfamily enzyme YgiQ (UPF0313 family)